MRKSDIEPPADFPNPNRPEEIWMNLELDFKASRERLMDAMGILIKLKDYDRAADVNAILTKHCAILYLLKNEYGPGGTPHDSGG
jgi:hypothetical protein